MQQTSAEPIDLTVFAEAINVSWEEKTPCVFATGGSNGPDVSLKGSAMVFDKDHLAFWERTHGMTIENLRQEPRVAVLYRNQARGVSFRRFFGVAEIHESGEIREQVKAKTIKAEIDKDPENKGIAVVIRVDRVLDSTKVIQQRQGS